jgi:hypothetical protein
MTWRLFSAEWSWWKSLSQRHKTLFSIQKGCIESLMHTLKWLLSLHAFALEGAMSFLHLFSILQLHQCNTCWWNFRCTKATDTLEMPFWRDKIQEASLFFSCKTTEATPMLPYLCAILLQFSLRNWFAHCPPCIKAKSLTFHPSPYCILVLKCRDLLFMTSN